jgi:hypothetical protein
MVTAASVRGQELAVPKKQGSPDRPGLGFEGQAITDIQWSFGPNSPSARPQLTSLRSVYLLFTPIPQLLNR